VFTSISTGTASTPTKAAERMMESIAQGRGKRRRSQSPTIGP
jgi:hypothetical protein